MQKFSCMSVAFVAVTAAASLTIPQAHAADIAWPATSGFVPGDAVQAVEQPAELKESTATGAFYTKDAVLYGPDGKQFLAKGVNTAVRGSADWGGIGADRDARKRWNDGAFDLAPLSATQDWGFNLIRLNTLVTDIERWGQPRTDGFDKAMQYVDRIVQKYTAAKIVILLDVHEDIKYNDSAKTAEENAAKTKRAQDQVDAFYAYASAKYKDNPYVWLGLPNEPRVRDAEWVQLMDRYIATIRSKGYTGIVSVGTPVWGQDLGSNWSFPGAKRSYDASMMPKLNTTKYATPDGEMSGNLLTEQHSYGGFCDAPHLISPAGVKAYIGKVAEASGVPGGGTPVFFGEYGYDDRDLRQGTRPTKEELAGRHCGQVWVPEKLASAAAVASANAYGAGIAFWSGSHGGDGRSLKENYRPYWHGDTPGSGLSEQGYHLWNLTHTPDAKLTTTATTTGTKVTATLSDRLSEAGAVRSAGLKRAEWVVNGEVAASADLGGKADGAITFETTAAKGTGIQLRTWDTAGNITVVSATAVAAIPAPVPAPAPVVPGPAPVVPGPAPQAGPVTITPSARLDSFTFKVSSVPAGGKINYSWVRDGKKQRAGGTNLTFWSGRQAGWDHASAEVQDASGKVVARSGIRNPMVPEVVKKAGSFTVKTPELPAGAQVHIEWTRNGYATATATTERTWWSGPQAGYSDVVVRVVDAKLNPVLTVRG